MKLNLKTTFKMYVAKWNFKRTTMLDPKIFGHGTMASTHKKLLKKLSYNAGSLIFDQVSKNIYLVKDKTDYAYGYYEFEER